MKLGELLESLELDEELLEEELRLLLELEDWLLDDKLEELLLLELDEELLELEDWLLLELLELELLLELLLELDELEEELLDDWLLEDELDWLEEELLELELWLELLDDELLLEDWELVLLLMVLDELLELEVNNSVELLDEIGGGHSSYIQQLSWHTS